MKKTTVFLIVLCGILVMPLLTKCSKDDPIMTGNADIGYEGFKSDAELFHEFAYRKESLILNALNYTSDGFTKAPFEGSVSRNKFDLFFLELEDFNSRSDKYQQAIERLEASGVLQRPTQTRGLFTSVKGFFTWASGSGKRSRDRIVTISSNMNSSERNKLYKSMRKEWKDKSNNEADFWKKLEKGDYDTSAPQMYNDFYHDGETDFPYLAQEKGLTLQKIVMEEGAKGIEAGANVMIDVGSTLVPGFGKGVTVVKVADNVEKMAKSDTWTEAAKHGFNAAADILEDAAGDIGNAAFNAGDVVSGMREIVDSKVFKEGDKNEAKGKVTVEDKNPKKSKTVVIAQKKGGGVNNDGSPSIYVTAKESISKEIDMLVKAGNWLITAVNEQGMRETVAVKVENGKIAIVEVNTEEPEEEDTSDEKINPKLLTYVLDCTVSLTGNDEINPGLMDYTVSIGTWVYFYDTSFEVYPKGIYNNKIFTTSYTKTFKHSDSFYGTVILSGNISLTIDETKQVVKTGKFSLSNNMMNLLAHLKVFVI